MKPYNHVEVEAKWKKFWIDNDIFKTPEIKAGEDKKYILAAFAYPSGSGLHVGHCKQYAAVDIVARHYKLKGKKLLNPTGWDSFGLPAENFAIKNGIHPHIKTEESIDYYVKQIKNIGVSTDWNREIAAHRPDYYKWTQWLFSLLYKKGLAYKKEDIVNWDPVDKTVIANEQVLPDGTSERSGAVVEQKYMSQWFYKITDYADRLIDDLEGLDWPESTKLMQKNWIGKSKGALVKFPLINPVDGIDHVEVFTTRIDTIFTGTFLLLAPENPLVAKLTTNENKQKVEEYLEATKKKSKLERTDLNKNWTAEFTGAYATNPANGEKIPVWITDFVLAEYGTGAVFGDAHDDRDYYLGKKYNIPLKECLYYYHVDKNYPLKEGKEMVEKKTVKAFVKHPSDDKYLVITEKGFDDIQVLPGGCGELGEDLVEGIKREITEETGYIDFKNAVETEHKVYNYFYNKKKDRNQFSFLTCFFVQLGSLDQIDKSQEEKDICDYRWVSKDEIVNILSSEHEKFLANRILHDIPFTGYGILHSSGKFDGLKSEEAKEKILEWGIENNWASAQINYRLRDWSVSRQRYWGSPIPILYNKEGDEKLVPQSDLPVILPENVEFIPSGRSPLLDSQEFQDSAQKYGDYSIREVETLDTFVCSSWYFLRFMDPHNENEFASKESMKNWGPVDEYIIGSEHSVLHLLYSRFVTKVLFDEGLIDFNEPFTKMRHPGFILGPDNRKMSKRWGNVINPTDVCQEHGADTLRMYEMFMGPFKDSNPWNESSIKGVRRFIERVYKLQDKKSQAKNKEVEIELNKLIKKVDSDIVNYSFNTAVSAFMIFINATEKAGEISPDQFKRFIICLSPFAPYVCEEIYSKLDVEDKKLSVYLEDFPSYDESLLIADEVTIVIQVNGKVRGRIYTKAGLEDNEVLALAKDKVKTWLEGKTIKFEKVIKNKMVTIAVA